MLLRVMARDQALSLRSPSFLLPPSSISYPNTIKHTRDSAVGFEYREEYPLPSAQQSKNTDVYPDKSRAPLRHLRLRFTHPTIDSPHDENAPRLEDGQRQSELQRYLE